MKNKLIIFIKFILVICCMLTIFKFSSDNSIKSTRKSDGVIIKLVGTIKKRNLTKKEIKYYTDILVVPVRKSAHFFIYFLLGILVTSLISEFVNIPKKLILYSLLVCILYSISDEVHQLFILGRSGEIRDILLDSTGSLCGSFIYTVIKTKLCQKNTTYY